VGKKRGARSTRQSSSGHRSRTNSKHEAESSDMASSNETNSPVSAYSSRSSSVKSPQKRRHVQGAARRQVPEPTGVKQAIRDDSVFDSSPIALRTRHRRMGIIKQSILDIDVSSAMQVDDSFETDADGSASNLDDTVVARTMVECSSCGALDASHGGPAASKVRQAPCGHNVCNLCAGTELTWLLHDSGTEGSEIDDRGTLCPPQWLAREKERVPMYELTSDDSEDDSLGDTGPDCSPDPMHWMTQERAQHIIGMKSELSIPCPCCSWSASKLILEDWKGQDKAKSSSSRCASSRASRSSASTPSRKSASQPDGDSASCGSLPSSLLSTLLTPNQIASLEAAQLFLSLNGRRSCQLPKLGLVAAGSEMASSMWMQLAIGADEEQKQAALERPLGDRELESAVCDGEMITRCPNEGCKSVAIVDITGKQAAERRQAALQAGHASRGHLDRDENGAPLSPEALAHLDKYRVRCRECAQDYCVLCNRMPYHIGRTCEQASERERRLAAGGLMCCRYCEGDLLSADAQMVRDFAAKQMKSTARHARKLAMQQFASRQPSSLLEACATGHADQSPRKPLSSSSSSSPATGAGASRSPPPSATKCKTRSPDPVLALEWAPPNLFVPRGSELALSSHRISTSNSKRQSSSSSAKSSRDKAYAKQASLDEVMQRGFAIEACAHEQLYIQQRLREAKQDARYNAGRAYRIPDWPAFLLRWGMVQDDDEAASMESDLWGCPLISAGQLFREVQHMVQTVRGNASVSPRSSSRSRRVRRCSLQVDPIVVEWLQRN